jgi:hypothetical protein
MGNFFSGLPAAVRWAFTGAGGLMSAFSSNLPPGLQTGGLYAGLALGIFGSIALTWHWINRWRERHGKTRLKLGPIHVIILGLVIAGLGVGWLLYRGTAAATPSSEQVAAITAPLRAALSEANARLALTPKAVTPAPPKRYTPYEKEQRLRAVDEIYGAITAKLSPAYAEGQTLFQTVQSGAADDTMPKKLIDHSNNVKAAFDDLVTLLNKYEYFSDIIAVAKQNTFNGLAEIVGSQNLSHEIGFLKTNVSLHASMRDVWNRDMIMFEANNANRDFGTYLTETLPRLKQKRSEIESAEVYAGQ